MKKDILYTLPPHIRDRFEVLHGGEAGVGEKIPSPPLSLRVASAVNEYFFDETPRTRRMRKEVTFSDSLCTPSSDRARTCSARVRTF
jgi:hypothetical protein